ncbi:MAG: efflux RND transporter permease subunit [Clostridiales bacterium]|nr:efflux RND transporter permease subunit [Clostridiales bacterium]
MSKISVKKPFTVLVGIIMVFVLGFVSFTGMTTDLLPSMSLPYVVVMTTYPGASPEKVESSVTEVLESGLGRVNGVENVMSSSSENVSLVILEFEEDTNMDSAMVKLSSQLDLLSLPDEAGSPMLLELSPDMMATMMVTVDYDGKDIFELTKYAEDVIAPELERQAGVASVDTTGLAEKYVEIRLNQDKIDEVNGKLYDKADGTLAEKEQDLEDAKDKLEDAERELNSQKDNLNSSQETSAAELAKYSKMMDEAVATQKAYEANVAALKANQMALETEKAEYIKAYEQINSSLQTMPIMIKATAINTILENMTEEQLQFFGLPSSIDSSDTEQVNSVWEALSGNAFLSSQLAEVQAVLDSLPADLDDALANDGAKLEVLTDLMESYGQGEMASQLTYENLQMIQQGYEVRIPEIDVALGNLNTEIAVAEAALEQVNQAVQEALDQYEQVEAGKITAAASFGAFQAQIASGTSQLESSRSQLEEADESLKDARKTALDNANLDSLLTMDTLSNILIAQNFDMPAGYITEDDAQYLLKVGEKYSSLEELEKSVLTRMDGIGDICIEDVADVTLLDNTGESYTKVNGNDALMISITKSSTAGTSEVAKNCNKILEEMETNTEGLHFTVLMDQGEYIGYIVDSVLSNLIWGALLAIIVLLLFLKDPRPTIVVAFSIPLSVLFAIVLMYFTDITLNIISLSGLALGVGMLVDNSIVVMENIYRMRSLGVSPARAAIKGAKQVSGAIIASTLTTICVFLPIVFTTGLTRQLFVDMGLTIAYSLGSSVVVALTVVPAMSSTILKNTKEVPHRWFDAVMVGYGKVLRWCLRFKIVPLAVSLGLLLFCVYKVTGMGMILIPDMGGTQMSMTMTSPEGTSKEDCYDYADEFMEMAMNLKGIDTVGMMDGSSTALSMMSGGSGGDTTSFTIYLVLDEEVGNNNSVIEKQLEEWFVGSDWEYSISSSNMDLGTLLGSGMEVEIQGKELDTLVEISEDMMDILGQVGGFENISNGQEDSDPTYKIVVNKKKAMRNGLTVAQIYQEIAGKLTTDKTSTTLTVGDEEYEIHIVNENDKLTLENLMDYKIETSVADEEGNTKTEKHKLKEFASLEEGIGIGTISRTNQVRHITVTADTMDGYNTTLLSREVSKLMDQYEVPEGYSVEIAGESENVMSSMVEMMKMIGLAVIFIYLIMVAQFQSLLSPFIVIFTIPLAFTGGLLGLLITGEQISLIAMMGFLVLSGVIVNNGIVFVDYTNQLRMSGMDKRDALVQAGKTRMRPILMTALTTIFAMLTMALDDSFAGTMGKGMAIVVIGGLAYATLMTLFVVPILYDLLYRRQLKPIDLGDLDTLDDQNVL